MKRILTSAWDWFDRFYVRFAKVLLILCLLAATGGVIIGTSATIQSGKNGKATQTLVECLNDWSAKSSAASKAVREASEKKDIAVTEFNSTLANEGEAFLALVEALVDPTTKPGDYADLLQTLQRTLEIRSDANQVVIDAQKDLDQARKDFPVPPPPALYCDLSEEVQQVGTST